MVLNEKRMAQYSPMIFMFFLKLQKIRTSAKPNRYSKVTVLLLIVVKYIHA